MELTLIADRRLIKSGKQKLVFIFCLISCVRQPKRTGTKVLREYWQEMENNIFKHCIDNIKEQRMKETQTYFLLS